MNSMGDQTDHVWWEDDPHITRHGMYQIGASYQNGYYGRPKDNKQAFRWYKKSADLMYPMGMANAGFYLLYGLGVAQRNQAYGIHLVTSAAKRGSTFACFCLGKWHKMGQHGFPKDRSKTTYWLNKCINGVNGKYDHLEKAYIIKAKEWLGGGSEEGGLEGGSDGDEGNGGSGGSKGRKRKAVSEAKVGKKKKKIKRKLSFSSDEDFPS